MRMSQDESLLGEFPKFCLDKEGCCPEATVFFIVGENVEMLCRYFASDIGFYAFTRFYAGPQFDSTGFRYKKEYFQKLPIPWSEKLIGIQSDGEFDGELRMTLGLTDEEMEFVVQYEENLLWPWRRPAIRPWKRD